MIFNNKNIRLFWWSEVKLMHKQQENYGDVMGKYLVEKISNQSVTWVFPKHFSIYNFFQPIYVTIGSVLAHVNKNCIVWGSGIISKDYPVQKANFLAVRGPQTRNYLMSLGYQVPEVYGDPALLLPNYYHPKIKKKYKYGIVPHYNDYKQVVEYYKNQNDFLVINLMTDNVEQVTDLFLQCEKIISSSLHGIIVSHTYQIPAIWVQFSDKLFGDGIKFQDYFESVEIPSYIPKITKGFINVEQIENLFQTHQSLPENGIIEKLKNDLMQVCPFKNS